jgi:hypothetical protein
VAGDGGGEAVLQRAVSGGVVGGVVAPELPRHAALGTSDGADCAWVLMPALSGLGVEVLCPGVPVAA